MTRRRKPEDYAFSSTRIRLMERQLLSAAFLERLVQAESLEETLRILQETRYGDALRNTTSFEEALNQVFAEQLKELDALIEDEDLRQLLFLKYDVHNIKVLLKEHYTQQNLRHLLYPYGTVFVPDVELWMDSPLKNPQETILQRAIAQAQEVEKQTGDLQRVDFVIDQAYFEAMAQLAKNFRTDFFTGYVAGYADFTNLLSLLRVRREEGEKNRLHEAFVAGGKLSNAELLQHFHDTEDNLESLLRSAHVTDALTQSFQSYRDTHSVPLLERARDHYIYHAALEGGKALYGPEVLYAYLLRLEIEQQNLRIILGAKRAGVQADAIRERIRDYEK